MNLTETQKSVLESPFNASHSNGTLWWTSSTHSLTIVSQDSDGAYAGQTYEKFGDYIRHIQKLRNGLSDLHHREARTN